MLFRSDSIPTAIFALKMAVRQFFRGPVFVPDEVRARRRALCDTCRFLKDHQCTLCTCFVSLKTSLASEKCPICAWPAETYRVFWRRRFVNLWNALRVKLAKFLPYA